MTTSVSVDKYLSVLADRYAPYYDVSWNEELAGRRFDLVARFKLRSERYFAVKTLTLYAYENRETALVQVVRRIDGPAVAEFTNYLKRAVSLLVQPNEEHMSTMLTGVLVAEEEVTAEARSLVERFRYSKSFKWLLEGWCDVRLLAVDLASGQVYSNKAGRAVREAYRVPAEKEGEDAS